VVEFEIPENWDSSDEWNQYWASQSNIKPVAQSWEFWSEQPEMRLLDFVKGQSQRKIWFAGCGIDIAPILYAYAGCNVLATDISPAAIEILQNINHCKITDLISDFEEMNAAGSLNKEEVTHPRLMIHDFREPLSEDDFDVVFNIKAYQGLPPASMRQSATTFYQALKVGGNAVFYTQNIQGERRNKIEDSLIDAGFYIPYNKSERWYRDKLDSTGIVYAMILGRPMPQWGEYGDRKSERAAQDREILRSFDDEYRQQQENESSEVKEVLESNQAKIARVIYNTG
jgi:hypothetical protein